MSWYNLLRRQLFKLDAERSHDLTLNWLSRIGRSPMRRCLSQHLADKPVQCMGLTFPNAVGLAAGLDKNATCIDAFGAMGFGFIEVGTVTPRAQEGNPKPRMFRLTEHEAIINRMGFNNRGVDYLVEQVKASSYEGILGINIGKNKDTAESEATEDYVYCMRKVYAYASYITVNISSPNTPGLRAMQHGEHLEELLGALKSTQQELQSVHHKYVPVLIKIAPDLNQQEVVQLAQAFKKHAIDGVIATNTTISRESVKGHPAADEMGGLSGKPVAAASIQVIQWLHNEFKGEIPIIGVGGIHDAEAAKAKLEAGATLVQLYTGFIYRGPELLSEIVNNL
ncbi:dihydroorotate dehydrogenase (quinone) [Aliidiomarina minuta]|uniref:Dihydroorotate dehydrogenase (quinone) n=1 Tax=Aliidiomarina minuta TaxID=880057 RepID=A0A432W6R2_9GAMM|nr:quinone-dependent dihydroorotate dehydrogenase [Aliidiomarina minuta]RUO25711.1 dihydroorotate dehydrogenase (quinone) [Aliidiomarina minuta]